MSGYVIDVESLSKRYEIITENGKEEFWALKDVSFKLCEGDVLGIIGRNGAGKSTLLKLLSGIGNPTYGKAKITGRCISILEAGLGFHKELTGRENILLNGSLFGLTKSEINNSMEDIIEFSGIKTFIDQPLLHYSSGMFLRLASSIALYLDADVLIIDEHLFMGDQEFRQKTMNRITEKIQNGLTVLIVSHSLHDILGFCNKCLLLENGMVKALDTPGRVLVKYTGDSLLITNVGFKKENYNIKDSYSINWKNSDDAPTTQNLKLSSIGIINANAELNKITTDNGFKIRVAFEKLKSDITVQLHIVFYDRYKNPLFSTDIYNNETNENLHDLYIGKTGTFAFEVEVPRNFIYKGEYSIQLRFGINTGVEDLIYMVPFTFQIYQSETRKDYISDALPIFVRPSFKWTYKELISLP